jgi:hypothetical protein
MPLLAQHVVDVLNAQLNLIRDCGRYNAVLAHLHDPSASPFALTGERLSAPF